MTRLSAIMNKLNSAAEHLSLMFIRPAPLQYAALCYRRTGHGQEILLITSRGTGRWVLPKGWSMKKKSGSGAAAREAYEEAGAVGQIGQQPVGTFEYRKWLRGGLPVQCIVRVYPLEVERLEDDFPEKDQRQRQWFSPQQASELVEEPQLQALIRRFCP